MMPVMLFQINRFRYRKHDRNYRIKRRFDRLIRLLQGV